MTIIFLQLWWYQIHRKSYSFRTHKQTLVWKNSFGSLVNITNKRRLKYFLWKFWVAWNIICPIFSKNRRVIKNENFENRKSTVSRKSKIGNRKSDKIFKSVGQPHCFPRGESITFIYIYTIIIILRFRYLNYDIWLYFY